VLLPQTTHKIYSKTPCRLSILSPAIINRPVHLCICNYLIVIIAPKSSVISVNYPNASTILIVCNSNLRIRSSLAAVWWKCSCEERKCAKVHCRSDHHRTNLHFHNSKSFGFAYRFVYNFVGSLGKSRWDDSLSSHTHPHLFLTDSLFLGARLKCPLLLHKVGDIENLVQWTIQLRKQIDPIK
jgi:hypothetical protein